MGAFSAFRDKRKKNKETPTVNAHYTKLARISALIRYSCIIFAVIFAAYSLSFHSDEITIENFRYMLKFIDFSEETDEVKGSFVEFDESSGNRGITFKSDLFAVLNENGITVTDWEGEIMLKDSFSSDHPKIAKNDKYIFCYDLGGKNLRVYNSYSLISKIDFDYPIYWFAAAEEGGFALVSSAKGYRSAVYIYDKELRLICSSLVGNKYVDFVDISEDGSEFITAAHYSEGGNIITQVAKYSTNSDSQSASFEQTFKGELPLGIYYTESGFALMTSDGLRSFDENNNIMADIKFGSKELLSGKVTENNMLLTFRREGLSGGTEAVIYDLNGNIRFTTSFDDSISDTAIADNKFYALYSDCLAVSDLSSGETTVYSVPSSYFSLVTDEESIILFSKNRAEYFDPASYDIKEEN